MSACLSLLVVTCAYTLDIAISDRSFDFTNASYQRVGEALQAIEEFDYYGMLYARLAILAETDQVCICDCRPSYSGVV